MPKKKPFILPGAPATLQTSEAFKGEIEQALIRFPKELGEEHPFNLENCEKVYACIGLAKAAVDKHLDFLISPGFYTTSKNKKAEIIINQFIQDTNFALTLREWIVEALVKGNGYLEIGEDAQGGLKLKVLNANRMYILRDAKGQILNYSQYTGQLPFNARKVITFTPEEVAHLAINRVGDAAYGTGILYPAMRTLENLAKSDKDLHTLISRKANNPYFVKLGTPEEPVSQADVDAFVKKLEWLHNQHEWVADHRTEIKTIDFGNIGEKFSTVLEHDMNTLFYTFQIPAVIMGMASVPEGLAKVQMDAFERRIQSLQAAIEKVVEEKIFKRVLKANGLDAHVEMEWGMPSEDAINKRVAALTTLLAQPLLSENLRRMLELDLAEQLGYEAAKGLLAQPEMDVEQSRAHEEEEIKQPSVPGEETETSREHLEEDWKEELQKDYPLEEWVGYNYKQYKKEIINFIRKDSFDHLAAHTNQERELGLLTSREISGVKRILAVHLDRGSTIRDIANDIKKLDLPARYHLDKQGEKSLQFSKEERPLVLARTETTRASARGSVESYKKAGVEEITWVAVPRILQPERTCPLCDRLNGQTVRIGENFFDEETGWEGPGPYAHTFCRCRVTPAISEVF